MPEHSYSNNPSSFIELQSVDSTNNYARGMIDEGMAVDGTAIFAYDQFAGKGQRANKWISKPGENIILSVVIKPPPGSFSNQFHLNACVAVSVHQFFSAYAGDATKIKWPNDLYWNDRKAGGILIENVIRNQDWLWAIAGIGININQTGFDPSIPNPVSLKQITGKDHHPVELAKNLHQKLNDNFGKLIKNGFPDIHQYYNDQLYKRNLKVRLKKDNRTFEATVKHVTDSGKLAVEHAFEEEFDFSEISWLN